MALGNLSVKVTADVGGFTSNMELASRVARDNMEKSAGSVDDFRGSILRASDELARAAAAMGKNMDAANDAIMASSEKSAESIQKISDTAEKANFKSLGEKIATAIGAGIGAGMVAAQNAWDGFVEATKTKSIIIGAAIGALLAGTLAGAIYTGYKLITGTVGAIVGLMNGSAYKSENIDALIATNNEVKDLQKNLAMSTIEAGALNEALKRLGVDKGDYKTVYEGLENSIRKNAEELDRLGVKYKDANGKFLEHSQILANAKTALDEYTAGWDRNKAAAAIGMGSYEQITAALQVNDEEIQKSKQRLDDYNLGISTETQAAVAKYEQTMRDFQRETDLTGQGFKRAIADAILPALTDLADWFKDGWPSIVQVFRVGISTIAGLLYAFKDGLYIVTESILAGIEAIGAGVGGVAAATVKILSGDLAGAQDALAKGWEGAKARIKLAGENIVAQVMENDKKIRMAVGDDGRSISIAEARKAITNGKSWQDAPKKETTSTANDPFNTAMNDASRQVAGIQYVIDHFEQFNGKVRQSKAAMAEFDVTMGKFSDAQRAQEGFKPLTESQKAQYIARNKLLDEGIEKERQLTVLRKFDKSSDQFAFDEKQLLDGRRLDIEWMGKSKVELEKLTEARRIDARVASLIKATELELGKDGKTITEEQRAAIMAKADAAKQAANVLIDQKDAKSKDPWFNASESIRKYGEDAANVGGQIGSAMTNAFKSAEDALTTFLTTGKLSFSDFARSVMAELARMEAKKILSGLFGSGGGAGGSGGLIGSVMGAISGGWGNWGLMNAGVSASTGLSLTDLAGAFADGGDPPVGRPSLVGERGPELFVPKTAGTIIPNEALRGGSSIVYSPQINIDSRTDRAEVEVLVNRAVKQGNAELVDRLQRTGRL